MRGLLEDGPMKGESVEVDPVEGRPPPTLDLPDGDGGTVSRRRLYRAAAVGYLGNLFNSSFGLAVRIAGLRRSAPADSPSASVLVAAELPIVVIEMALAAVLSFTLIGPLNLPWWTAVLFLLVP